MKMEYASTVWDPHKKIEIKKLENVQRASARFVTNCISRQPGCVTNALNQLQWPSLKKRRKETRLKLFHHATSMKTAINIPEYIKQQKHRHNTRNSSEAKFHQPYARTDAYKNSFFPNTIKEWNELPSDITETINPVDFARRLSAWSKTTV